MCGTRLKGGLSLDTGLGNGCWQSTGGQDCRGSAGRGANCLLQICRRWRSKGPSSLELSTPSTLKKPWGWMKSSMVAVWPETSWPGIEPGESQSFQRKRSQKREFVSLGCCCSATLAKEVGGGCSGPDVEVQEDDLMVGVGLLPLLHHL